VGRNDLRSVIRGANHRALGNAGLWLMGRLQTNADRARVIDGLSDVGGPDGGVPGVELAKVVKMLAQRWFLMRDVHAGVGTMFAAAALGHERDAGADDAGGDPARVGSSGSS
jgi:hypothetical protein